MRILFLSRWFPWPPDNGSKLRVLNLLEAIAPRHQVTLLSFASEDPDEKAIGAVGRLCCDVHAVLLARPTARPPSEILRLFSREPRSIKASHNPEMLELVRRIASVQRPHVLIASQVDMAPYAMQIQDAPRILDELELMGFYDQFSRASSALLRIRRGLMWSKRKAYVARLVRGFKACSVVSRPELELARRVAPAYPGFVLIPNGVSTTMPSPQKPVPGTIIYAGAVTYAPNMDAVRYFAHEILPFVRKECPEASLTVTGETRGADLRDLGQHPGIRFVGRVEDIRSAVAASWCSVAPIRQGGGTRIKILESLSLGTPVISTSKGVEGLELVPGRHFLLADDPRSFADCVLQILRNPELRARIGEDGRSEVHRRYNWQEIGERFSALVDGVVAPGSA